MTASQIWWKDQSAEFYDVIPKHSPSPPLEQCGASQLIQLPLLSVLLPMFV